MSAAPVATSVAPVHLVAGRIAAARSVVILCHVSPDADTLGSAFALGLALEARDTAVQVAVDEPELPQSLADLPGRHLLTADPTTDADLVICVDVASTGRLGRFADLLATARDSIVIDHHASNPGFGRLDWIEPHTEATVLMIARLLDALRCPLTRDIAAALYAGLATDTVNFRFASPAAHRLAARLLDTGVDAAAVLRPIQDTHPFGWLTAVGTVLTDARLDRTAAGGRGRVVAVIPLATAAGLRREDLDAVIDIVRTTSEAEVAIVARQTDDTTWQVSLRSHGAVDVAAVVGRFGGGGHPRAAGFTFTGDPDTLVTTLDAALAPR